MTTVAYRSGVMACDSCWTYGGTVDVLATKIVRLSSGALLGHAGQNDARAVVTLLDKARTQNQLPSYEALAAVRADVLGLLVLPTGRVFKVGTTIVSPENWTEDFDGDDIGIWEINGPFAAIGSGGDMALVAMASGKNAREAVTLACRFDLNSRLPLHSVTLAWPKKRKR